MGAITDTYDCPNNTLTDSSVRGDCDKSPLGFAMLYLLRLISWKRSYWPIAAASFLEAGLVLHVYDDDALYVDPQNV